MINDKVMNNNQIIIFGDICPDNDYRHLFNVKKNAAFSNDIANDISHSALVIGNLECPATDSKVPITKCGPSLRANMNDVKKLKNIGFDILSLANNHILDYGVKGLEDTLQVCKENGIKIVGAGRNCEDAGVPIIYEIKNQKIGIVSFAEAEFNLARTYDAGANHFDPYESFDVIGEVKKACDYVIVLYHGGIEYYKYPSPLLQKKCRRMAKAGADLILCQHSHCIGTMEEYNGSTIVYGQGNSIFGYRHEDMTWNEGLLVKVDLTKDYEVQFKLLKATPNGIEYADKKSSALKMQQMKEDSQMLNDTAWVNAQWSDFVDTQKALDLSLLYGKNRVFNKLNRILRNKMIDMFYTKKTKMITMNLLRCESHHEVVQTILENDVFGYKQ